MYYSVVIDFIQIKGKDSIEKCITKIDYRDLENIKTEIVKPYLIGCEFIVDGYVIEKSKITRIKIVETDKTIEEIREYKQSRLSSGIIYVYK